MYYNITLCNLLAQPYFKNFPASGIRSKKPTPNQVVKQVRSGNTTRVNAIVQPALELSDPKRKGKGKMMAKKEKASP